MRRNARWLAGGVAVLVLGLGLLLTSRSIRADDEDEKNVKAAQEIVLKATEGDAAAKEKAGKELMAKKLGLKAAMYVFKLRTAGGVGVGDKAGAISPDGIEAKLINLGKKELGTAAKKEGPALAKAAQIADTMSYVADAYTPTKKVGDKDPKDWMEYVKEMRSSAEDLAKAADKGDSKGIKAAATKLTAACNECHGKFRD
jgi:soluble cytochrome b562